MNSGNQLSNNQNSPRIQSFLESLKNRPPGQEGASPFANIESFGEKRRLEEQRRQEFFRSRTHEFNEVYSQTKQNEQKKILQIQEQLKQLAKSVEKLNRQVVQTVTNTVVEPGVYHETFFDHILSLITLLQKRVNESGNWLSMFNSRSKKKSFYWAMASKKGTKFTQSLDRNVATSVG